MALLLSAPGAVRRALAAALAGLGLLSAAGAFGPSAALAEGGKRGAEAKISREARGRDRAPLRGKAAPAKGGKRRRRGSPPSAEPTHHTPSLALLKREIKCPDEMVAVGGRFCVDRYESTLVEAESEELLSPYYPPTPRLVAWSLEKWSAARDEEVEGSLARLMPLPEVPAFQREAAFRAKAMSWPGSVPSGYVSGELASGACKAVGKRLCQEAEWVTACRGEKQTQFPYGARYQQDACNVFREDHPAHVLHGEFSVGLSDPRLNLIEVEGKPLLRTTGATAACVSRWGDDGVYDMVGNLDEWVDDEGGTFVGGFYARATRNGCDARVRTHPSQYFDYSTGVRCCKDPDLEQAWQRSAGPLPRLL